MAKILFAWELGGDYGHLSRLIPVALALKRRGHDPVFALRELIGAQALLGPHGFTWFQAPLWLGRLTNLPDAIGYAEMLMRFGFLNARALVGICRAWRNLVGLLKPDLLVLDHAPTALLATRGMGVPRMNLGTGFLIPPAQRPLPPFRWWEPTNQARLVDSEERVRQTANEALFMLGAEPLASLREMLACDAELLCCFPDLDHYPARAAGEYAGPVFSLGQGVAPAWPAGEGARVFAYLKPDYPGLERVLDALRDARCRVLAHVPGAARKTLQDYTSERMAFSAAPVDIEAARSGTDVAVGHGGVGMTTAMLLAGKPMLLLPTHMEQMMFARCAEQAGMAAVLQSQAVAGVARSLKRLLLSAEAAQAARRFALAHAGYDQQATVELIADRAIALLGTA